MNRVLAAYDRWVRTEHIAEVLAASPLCTREVNPRRRETGLTSRQPTTGSTVAKIDIARLTELVCQRRGADAAKPGRRGDAAATRGGGRAEAGKLSQPARKLSIGLRVHPRDVAEGD